MDVWSGCVEWMCVGKGVERVWDGDTMCIGCEVEHVDCDTMEMKVKMSAQSKAGHEGCIFVVVLGADVTEHCCGRPRRGHTLRGPQSDW